MWWLFSYGNCSLDGHTIGALGYDYELVEDGDSYKAKFTDAQVCGSIDDGLGVFAESFANDFREHEQTSELETIVGGMEVPANIFDLIEYVTEY